ncbi:enoyl-CoA hydratase [Serratia sp. S1B]|nr:enoyl-CoA hydratase [Serratia sp. S1B]
MTLTCLTQPHQHLQASLEHGVLTLAIDRAIAKNAIYSGLYLWIAQALDQANVSDEVRVVVLRGAGDDFTAGNDMQDFLDSLQNPTNTSAAEQPPFILLKSAAKLSKPLIVAVKGVAIGIGVTLLLHADLVYADESAVFQLPFVSLGLSPEGGASKLLQQQIGYHHAAELLLTAQKFNAHTAEKFGLINQVFSNEHLRAPFHLMALMEHHDVYDFASETAKNMAKLPIASLKQTKALMKQNLLEILAWIDEEAEIFMQRVKSPELHEAINAFLEKREADFSKFN